MESSSSSSSSEGVADQGMIIIVIDIIIALNRFLVRYCRSEKPTTNHSGEEGFDNGIRLGSTIQYSFLPPINQDAVDDKEKYGCDSQYNRRQGIREGNSRVK